MTKKECEQICSMIGALAREAKAHYVEFDRPDFAINCLREVQETAGRLISELTAMRPAVKEKQYIKDGWTWRGYKGLEWTVLRRDDVWLAIHSSGTELRRGNEDEITLAMKIADRR